MISFISSIWFVFLETDVRLEVNKISPLFDLYPLEGAVAEVIGILSSFRMSNTAVELYDCDETVSPFSNTPETDSTYIRLSMLLTDLIVPVALDD